MFKNLFVTCLLLLLSLIDDSDTHIFSRGNRDVWEECDEKKVICIFAQLWQKSLFLLSFSCFNGKSELLVVLKLIAQLSYTMSTAILRCQTIRTGHQWREKFLLSRWQAAISSPSCTYCQPLSHVSFSPILFLKLGNREYSLVFFQNVSPPDLAPSAATLTAVIRTASFFCIYFIFKLFLMAHVFFVTTKLSSFKVFCL